MDSVRLKMSGFPELDSWVTSIIWRRSQIWLGLGLCHTDWGRLYIKQRRKHTKFNYQIHWKYTFYWIISPLNGQFTQKMIFSDHLLTLMWIQSCISFFLSSVINKNETFSRMSDLLSSIQWEWMEAVKLQKTPIRHNKSSPLKPAETALTNKEKHCATIQSEVF